MTHGQRQFSSTELYAGRSKLSRSAFTGRDKTGGQNGDSVCRLASLNKQLQPIKLFAQHGFYSWRHFLEAARNKSADAVRELKQGITPAAG
jgi:hypothetical protein